MPRKPKPPPTANMIVQGLSDGREVRPLTYVDDFTGQAMPVVQDTRPTRRKLTSTELNQALKQKKGAQRYAQAHAERTLLETIKGLVDKPEHRPFKRRL